MAMSHAAKTAYTAVGIIGNIISFGLFLSPCPTFFRIYKRKDVEEFQPYPYLCTVLNCLFWMFYGLPLVVKDNMFVFSINSVGLVIELFYLAVYSTYAPNKKKRLVAMVLIGEAVFVAAIVLVSMLALQFKHRALLVGIVCDVFNIIMYASPLAVWKKVIKTKSVEYMPFCLSVANFLNGSCWTAYALIRFDKFMLISNGLGAIFGAIQLILYGCYYSPKSKKEGKPEVQMSGQA